MIYNLTTQDKTYGSYMQFVVVPASEEEGERGPGVPIDLKANIALFLSKDQVRADLEAGVIQIENSAAA